MGCLISVGKWQLPRRPPTRISFAFESMNGVKVIIDELGFSSFPFSRFFFVAFSLSYSDEDDFSFSHFRNQREGF
jgi:hypothetical protein